MTFTSIVCILIKRDIEVESKCECGHSVTITDDTVLQITCDLGHISSVDCILRALSLVKNSCACSLAGQKKILTNYHSCHHYYHSSSYHQCINFV